MKKILIAALALVAGTLGAKPKAFEGTVRYQVTSTEGKQGPVMEMSLKGEKMRMEAKTEGHQAVMIMDTKAKQIIMLMPERKQYMVHKVDAAAGKPQDGKGKGSLTKTGRSETIAGYKADEWVYEAAGRKSAMWGTTELGAFVGNVNVGPRGQEAEIEVPAELKDKGFFPLRMVMRKGEKEGKVEATEVKPGSLASSLFEVPSGYTEMKGGPMMGGAEGSARMEEAMKNMSPEQRAAMEKMMKKMGRHEE